MRNSLTMEQSNDPVGRDGADAKERRPERITATNNEARILEAAEHVFAKHGFRGATTAMIAAKAGVTKPNIYYYFRNKEALYLKLLEGVLAVWADSLNVIDENKSPEECLRLYVKRKMAFSRTRPRLSRIFATEIISGAPYIASQNSRMTKPLLQEKVAIIERWILDGKIKAIDPHYLIFMVWASTQAYADFAVQMQILLRKRALDESDFASATDTITTVMLYGVLADPGGTKPERAVPKTKGRR